MNVKEAKNISIENVLKANGYYPTKSIGNDLWYKSPFRFEKTQSFKINTKLNRWFDHGEGFGGNVIDFVVKKFGYTVSESLKYLQSFSDEIDSFSFQKQIIETPLKEYSNNLIEKIIPIQHLALIQYMKTRSINEYKNIELLSEIHYSIKDKKYFAIGFRNNSGGFEIRSKFAKICLGKKDITQIANKSNTLRIFEGFFDYLSFNQITKISFEKESDYMILNSVALLEKNISILNKYDKIELYLDNDAAGDKYTKMIMTQFQQAKDARISYKEYKDLNEFLCQKKIC